MRQIQILGAVLGLCVLVVSCAKIIPPDGGEKDQTPPAPLRMVPENQSTNFQGKSIYIEFDEFVRLNDIFNQLVVSPPLEKLPEIKVKKKSVILNFQEELKSNVTYTLSFGEGITDITEMNPAENLQYVFATGNTLDSLTFSGQIIDSYSGVAQGAVKIMLYDGLSDTLPRKSKPYYFTQSKPDGTFDFSYLAAGTYQLFALKEINRNYLFDDPEEEIAFSNDPVIIGGDSLLPMKLFLSIEQDTMQYISSWDADSSGFLKMALNTPWKASTSLMLQGENPERGFTWRSESDTVFAWVDKAKEGEISTWIFTENQNADTLKYTNFAVGKKTLPLMSKLPSGIDAKDTLTLVFERPISKIDSSKISIYKDSIPVEVTAAPTPNPFELRLNAATVDGDNYQVVMNPGAVISREGWTNDTIDFRFKAYPFDHYGNLILTISIPELDGVGVLELYNSNGKVVESRLVKQSMDLTFSRLMPATYKLRLIDDRNANGKWDPAFFDAKEQPEKVFNFNEDIVVRSNWDMELQWEILNIE
jgi:hypothetical protein